MGDEARERAAKLAARREKAEAARAAFLKRAAEAKARAEAARAMAIKIKLAKEKARRAKARAEAELKAKTERLNAKIREQKLKEAIRIARAKNLKRYGDELAAKTAANEEEAEEIYGTAKEVAAKAKGFKYIGLQYGGECWMGNKFGRFGQYPDSACTMKCHLEKDIICGGSWRNSVYSVGAYDPETKRAETARE